MAIGTAFTMPLAQAVDVNGVPYVGGQLLFYVTGTSTPLDTFADVGLTTPNLNPVPADAAGFFPQIWLSPSQAYKVALEDADGVEIWTADPFGPAAGGAAVNVAGMVGEVRGFAGLISAIPPYWYACYGQAVSRTDFAAAFAVLGTTWGAGDGSTTFNVPDLRGRVMAGLDNMGGVAANRITAGVSGVPGTTLGGVGGDQRAQQDTLTATATNTTNEQPHTHGITLPISGHATSGGANPPGGSNGSYTTDSVLTGITISTEVAVESGLEGQSQNVQPTAMVNLIIYLGA